MSDELVRREMSRFYFNNNTLLEYYCLSDNIDPKMLFFLQLVGH